MRKSWLIAAVTVSCLLVGYAWAADTERGRALYELRCSVCHTDSVHSRTKRAARDYEEIRAWVTRWNLHLGGWWGIDAIDDVTAYLNQRFYSYECATRC